MEINKHIQFLQMAYAGALADSLLQYDKEGVLTNITNRKRQENIKYGKMRAAQFNITTPEEVFIKLAELFGCASWTITGNSNDFTAQSNSCKLCTIAKNIGASVPCHLYCLDPMEGMVKALKNNAVFTIKETLWNGSMCKIQVKSE